MDWFSSHVAFVLFILSFLTYSLPNKNFLYGFSCTYGVTRKALKKRVSGSSQRKTTKVRKRKMKKCEIALTLTAVAEWETQKYVELGILWIVELIGQEYDRKLCQGLTPQRGFEKSLREELQGVS